MVLPLLDVPIFAFEYWGRAVIVFRRGGGVTEDSFRGGGGVDEEDDCRGLLLAAD
jgi:hypothetical protein